MPNQELPNNSQDLPHESGERNSIARQLLMEIVKDHITKGIDIFQKKVDGLQGSMEKDGSVSFSYNGISLTGAFTEMLHIESLTLESKKIMYTPPIEPESFEKILLYSQKILAVIKENKKVSGLINEKTEFECISGMRMRFTVESNGGKIIYVATPFDISRVVAEPALSEEESRELQSALAEDEKILEENEDAEISIDWEWYLKKFPENQRKKAAAELWKLIERRSYLKEKASFLNRKQKSVVLLNEESGSKIYEYSPDVNPQTFERWYYSPTASLSRYEYYEGTALVEKEEWTGKTSHFYRYYPDGRPSVERTVDEKGHETGTVWKSDGTPIEKRKAETTWLYNDKGEVTHAVVQSEGPPRTWIHDKENNEYYDPSKNIEELKKHIRTAEQFHLFEEIHGITREPKTREYGRELYGLTEVVHNITQSTGITIDMESKIPGRDFGICSMEILRDALPKFSEEVGKYPNEVYKNVNVEKIYLVTGTEYKGEIVRLGGTEGSYLIKKENIIMSIDHLETVFHHEIFHAIDFKTQNAESGTTQWWKEENIEEQNEGERQPENFARTYGETNNLEDKATIAECVMNTETSKDLRRRAKGNEVLTEKIQAIEHMYYIVSGGKMDEVFWQDISKGVEINAEYWEKREKEGFTVNNELEEDRKELETYRAYISQIEELKPMAAEDKNARDKLIELYINATHLHSARYTNPIFREFYNLVFHLKLEEQLPYWSQMIEKGNNPLVYIYSTASEAYEKAGMIPEAIKIVEDGRKKGLHTQYQADSRIENLRRKLPK